MKKIAIQIMILGVLALYTLAAFAWDLNSGPTNIRKDFHPKYRCEYGVGYRGSDTILDPEHFNIYSYDDNKHLIKEEYYYIHTYEDNRVGLISTITYQYDQSGRVTNRTEKKENNDYEYQYQQKYNDEGQTTYKKSMRRNVKTDEIPYEEEYYDFEYDDIVKNKVLAYKYKKVVRYTYNRFPYYIDSTTRAEKKSIVYRNSLGNVDSVYTWHYSQTARWDLQFLKIEDITKYKEKSRLYVKYANNNKATEISYLEREGSNILNLSDEIHTEFKISDIEWYKTNGQFFDLTNPYVPEGDLLHLDTSNLIQSGKPNGYAINLEGKYKMIDYAHCKEIIYSTDPKTGDITRIDFSEKSSWPPCIKFPDNHGGYNTNINYINIQYDDFGELLIHKGPDFDYNDYHYKIGKYNPNTGLPQEYEIYYCDSPYKWLPDEANGLIRFENPFESSVNEIPNDVNEPIHYFTLSGLPVSEECLTLGIYIKVTNGKAEKVRL